MGKPWYAHYSFWPNHPRRSIHVEWKTSRRLWCLDTSKWAKYRIQYFSFYVYHIHGVSLQYLGVLNKKGGNIWQAAYGLYPINQVIDQDLVYLDRSGWTKGLWIYLNQGSIKKNGRIKKRGGQDRPEINTKIDLKNCKGAEATLKSGQAQQNQLVRGSTVQDSK